MSQEILEAVAGLGKQITEQKAATTAQIDAKFSEAEKLAAAANQKIEDEVKTLNEDLAKKGATLEEIQKEIKQFKAKAGRFSAGENPNEKKTAEIISEAFEEHFAEIKGMRKATGKFEMKAAGTMTAAANLAGNVVATYDLTPQVRGRRRINIRDLIPVINSSTGSWKFYRQRIPVGEGSFGFQTTHGAMKNQLDYDLDEQTITVDYLAGFALLAKQMLQDLPFLQNYVANELIEDYKRTESQQFFGLLTAGATGSNATGSTVLAEKYIDWIAALMGNDWYPNAIVTDHTNWATILKTKPNDYNVPGGITISADGTVMFCGLPLIAQNNIGAGHTLIGDFSKAAIIQAEGLSADFFEQDGTNVRQNLITARVEARVALAILRPDAFIFA
jgi:HK97 family phage major capsid protein